MRFLHSFVPPLLLLAAGAAQAASSWGFDEGTLTVTTKKAGAVKEKFNEKSPLKETVNFGSADALKVTLTAKENGKGKRPHQAFLILQEPETGLEAPFPMEMKDTGKATVEIKHVDLPVQLLISTKPLKASIILASFGSSEGYNSPIFDVQIKLDPSVTMPAYEKPLRYGKREEIHHVFRADPKSPPKIVSLVFALAVVAAVPALFLGWAALGGNVAHMSKAFAKSPLSHGVFFGSLIAMELVFYMYYTSWNLFQTLPAMGIVGATTFLSGTKALGEVQSRRLAGER